jgi:hypothetical protein
VETVDGSLEVRVLPALSRILRICDLASRAAFEELGAAFSSALATGVARARFGNGPPASQGPVGRKRR